MSATLSLKAAWDQVVSDPAFLEVVDHYTFQLDSDPVITVPNVIDPTVNGISVVFAAGTGSHTISVVVVDQFGQTSAPATASFALKGGPDGVKTLRITR